MLVSNNALFGKYTSLMVLVLDASFGQFSTLNTFTVENYFLVIFGKTLNACYLLGTQFWKTLSNC